jgi:arylsulfatase A-like enzyme
MSFVPDREPYVAAAHSKPSPQSPGAPNIILITMDTARQRHFSIYGYERDTAPNLQRLVEGATLYTRAIASGDMTLTTHASIFTGMYASQHKAYYDAPASPEGRPLDDKFLTLAEMLSERGYLTLGVVANYAYLSKDFGLHQGFQHYDDREPAPFLGEAPHYYLRQAVRNLFTGFATPYEFDQKYRRAEDINAEVFTLLDKVHKRGRPFFLFINYMDAHWPYLPPPPFDTVYPGKEENFTTTRYYALKEKVMKLERKLEEKERRHLVSQYDGGIKYLDFHLGKLMARLHELGLYENSLILVTSDHGETFGERELLEHSVSVYQDQVHIPLIVKHPNSKEQKVVNEFVSVIDIMPTVFEVVAEEIPGNLPGQSLLRREPGNSRIIISESFPNHHFIQWHHRFDRFERALFSWPFKFISSTTGKKELYDLSKDPNETANLYDSNVAEAQNLEMLLEQWLNTMMLESDSPAKLDKQTLDRLKSLGYIR